jgi:hypothetical protein
LTAAKSLTLLNRGDEPTGQIHDDDAGEEAAEHMRRAEPARRAPRDVPPDLDDDLERGAGRGGEEDDAEQIARHEAAEPGAEDRRRTRQQDEHGQPSPGDAASLRQRRGDPEPLGDVVDHEPHDEERPQRELSERERGADREPLTQVVKSNPDRDERRQREPAHAGSAAAGADAGRERAEEEEAEGNTEQHEPCTAQRARQGRLELERLGQGLDGEEREQPSG